MCSFLVLNYPNSWYIPFVELYPHRFLLEKICVLWCFRPPKKGIQREDIEYESITGTPLDMVDIFWDPRSLGHSARSAQRWSLCFWTCCAQWPVVLRIYGQEFILRHHQFDFFSQFDVQKSTIKNCHFAIELVHISMGFHEKIILAYEVQDGAHQL